MPFCPTKIMVLTWTWTLQYFSVAFMRYQLHNKSQVSRTQDIGCFVVATKSQAISFICGFLRQLYMYGEHGLTYL